jgi:FkbM family methyltransferase
MYPLELSKYFSRVVTFEPEPTNFECLQLNTKDSGIESYQVALGQHFGRVGLGGWDKNTGSAHVVKGSSIQVIPIDSMSVIDCDLLQLDIEGAELSALIGAEQTLLQCKPVVMIERRRHGTDPHSMLLKKGYEEAESNATDSIYVYAGE